MDLRAKIAWHEYQNPEQYAPYYGEQATMRQALLYIAFGLKPMSDELHRVKRKTPLYKVNKSKDTNIAHAKELLFAALRENRLQAYGQKGIGKAVEYTDKWVYSPFPLYLSPNHEPDHSLIPVDLWDQIQTNFDENYVFIPGKVSFINVKIQTDKLLELFHFEYLPPMKEARKKCTYFKNLCDSRFSHFSTSYYILYNAYILPYRQINH